MSHETLDDLIELGEIARRLHTEAKTLRNRIYLGKFPRGKKIPGSRGRFYSRSEIEAWLTENLREA